MGANYRNITLLLLGILCAIRSTADARIGRPATAKATNKVGAATAAAAMQDCTGKLDGVFMPNPKGCQYFFYCHKGQALEANCPGQLWFDLTAGTCAKQDAVQCTLNQPAAPETTPLPPPAVVTESESVQCPERDSAELTFVASRVDCGRYFICYRGLPRRQQCIPDLHWNAAVNRCDYPRNAKCPKKRDVPTCPRRGQVFFPHPEKCDYFIYCQNGHLSLQQCPFYHHWDLDTNSCRWRNMARCAIVE